MNKIILMGRLTRDPEVRYAQNAQQTAVARFSLAVDRKHKRENEQNADFFNCTAFGKLGEFVEKYLKKGSKIALVGEIRNNRYTNQAGQTIYDMQVIADEIDFAESKAAAGQQTAAPDQAPDATADGFMNIPDGIDEELPFN